MNSSQDCIICDKHKDFNEFAGIVIAKQGGLNLGHFPFLPDETSTRGHLLIEPSRHITDFDQLTTEEAAALGSLIKLGSGLIKQHLGAEHVCLFRINDKVAHLHFHVVPRYPVTPKDYWGLKIMSWPDRPTLNLEDIKKLSAELRDHAQRQAE